jgi:hypothetical protein
MAQHPRECVSRREMLAALAAATTAVSLPLVAAGTTHAQPLCLPTIELLFVRALALRPNASSPTRGTTTCPAPFPVGTGPYPAALGDLRGRPRRSGTLRPLRRSRRSRGVAAGQAAQPFGQGLVDVQPRLARRAVDLPLGAGGPAGGAGPVGVGPGQDFGHGQGRLPRRHPRPSGCGPFHSRPSG